ncbi:MAG: HAD family hydrolase [Clostridia bacterium]|nr:HAD family hydrolase [Clostridia bacterium]
MALIRFGTYFHECKAIIFDKDGTLLDTFAIWPRLIKRRLEFLSREISLGPEQSLRVAQAMGWATAGEKCWVMRRSPIVLGTREQTAAAVSTVLYLDLGLPWDEAMNKVLKAFSACDQELGVEWQAIPIPGVPEMLRRLAEEGCQVALATNDSLERARQLMVAAKLDPYITAYACRDEVSDGKPAPDMVELACRRLGISPHECAVVGDSILDMRMGKAAGVGLTVGVLTGAFTQEEFSGWTDVVIASAAMISPVGS